MIQYDPCCPTYKMVQAPIKSFGSSSIVIGDDIYLIGGYYAPEGHEIQVVTCSQGLKKKLGSHAIVMTETLSYTSIPQKISKIHKYSISNDHWIESLIPEIPFEICDAALILVSNKLFVIGGFKLVFDGILHFFKPQNSVWILDLRTRQWSRGPDLPNEESIEEDAFSG